MNPHKLVLLSFLIQLLLIVGAAYAVILLETF